MPSPTSVKQYQGEFTDALVSERIFIGVQPVAGAALITTTTTGGHPTLWNPLGSGVNISIISLELSMLEDGANAPSTLGWYKTSNAGAGAATGAVIPTATLVDPIPALVGSGGKSKVYWSPTTNTFTTAPAYYAPIPYTLFTAASNSAIAPIIAPIFYKGSLGIAPNTALSICSTAATTTVKFVAKITWEEIPRT